MVVIPVYFIQLPIGDKSVWFVDILIVVDVLDDEPPEGSNEVSDHEHNYNQSEDLVWVHDNILSLDSISSCRIVEVALDQPLNPTNIEYGNHFGKPRKSDHPRVDSVFDEQVKWECRKEVYDHPATFRVSNRDFLDVFYNFLSLFVLVRLEAVEYKIQSEDNGNEVVEILHQALRSYIKGYVEDWGGTGVTDNDQNGCIKERFPSTIHTDDKIFQLHEVL